MARIALVGAFDRFNYGDLLFPLIVSAELLQNSHATSIRNYALKDSDLSRFGAAPTHALRKMFRDGGLQPGDAVIFAGGGTIGANWSDMHANILGGLGNSMLYYLSRAFGRTRLDGFSRWYFGGRSVGPWVGAPEDYPVDVSVGYNAVGASELENLPSDEESRNIAVIARANYVSVRDTRSMDLLQAIQSETPLYLAPDSAVLMSEKYPVSWLEENAGRELLEHIAAGPYVCFQADLAFVRRNLERIVAVLADLHSAYGLGAALLPIGRYVGLEDHVALAELQSKLVSPGFLIGAESTVWEIMLVIARANLFVGSSLHGAVTSQSFSVPHLGLDDHRRQKLAYYLGTWDIPEQSTCIGLESVVSCAERVLAVPSEVRERLSRELIDLSHQNFSRLAAACSLVWR